MQFIGSYISKLRPTLYFTERIQKKLGLPEKEFEKFKFAIVSMGRPNFINDDDTIMNLNEFKALPSQSKYTNFSFLMFFNNEFFQAEILGHG